MKRRKKSSAVYILIILCLLVALGLLLYDRVFATNRVPVGIWTYDREITGEVISNIQSWIADAPEESRKNVPIEIEPLQIRIILKIANDGTYEQSVDKAFYEQTCTAAYEGFDTVLKELVRCRFKELGIDDDGQNSDEDIEALIEQAVGMSGVEYLKKAVPELVLPYDEYILSYSGKGSVSVRDGYIYFADKAPQKLLFDKDTLLIDGKIYQKE